MFGLSIWLLWLRVECHGQQVIMHEICITILDTHWMNGMKLNLTRRNSSCGTCTRIFVMFSGKRKYFIFFGRTIWWFYQTIEHLSQPMGDSTTASCTKVSTAYIGSTKNDRINAYQYSETFSFSSYLDMYVCTILCSNI